MCINSELNELQIHIKLKWVKMHDNARNSKYATLASV